MALGLGLHQIGKKVIEVLPAGQWRYVLPMYFFCVWGCIGRLLQTTMPHWGWTLLLESLLVGQEIVAVWAYMHYMGPTAYTIRFVKNRGKVEPGFTGTTVVYRTVHDIPPKVFAYNSIIAVHAVSEAILVLIGGFIPLVMNVNIVDACLSSDSGDYGSGEFDKECSILHQPVPRSKILTNTFISFFLETLVADGLFCLLAVQKQRNAHSFLATWRVRSFGSIGIFIFTAMIVGYPVFNYMLGPLVIVADDKMFGIRMFPEFLQCMTELRNAGCIAWDGIVKSPWPEECATRFPTFYSTKDVMYPSFNNNEYPSEEWCLGW